VRRRKSQQQSAIDPVETDFSLASNGRSYIEINGEAAQIFEPIEYSSASVIGIAGVRGAGKSSLSKKVLDACSARGYFTLLIPSPISYEPREFLLAIFQRIVDSALQRTTAAIEGSETLVDTGRERARQVLRGLIVLTVGIIFSVATAASFQYYIYQQYLSEIERQREGVYLNQRKATVENQLKSVESRLAAQGLSSDDEKKLSELRLDLVQEQAYLERRGGLAKVSSGDRFGVCDRLCFQFLAILVRRLYIKYRRFVAHPEEVGLLIACREMLEVITYQATLSSTKDIALKFQWLTGKLTNNKQLAERPLSLPGLTATCTKFLADVAEVFALKVVICVDELDKITDATQLMELLKGIKGILGQDRTHFLLTISEDAMAYFSERLSADRNLIESSFEQIVYLDRIPMDIARKLIAGSVLSKHQDGNNFEKNCVILWIFAGGIPREIKRNIFTVHADGLDIGNSPPAFLWKVLFLDVVSSMQRNPPRTTSVESQFNFLRGLEALLILVRGASDATKFQELMESFSQIVTEWFKPLLSAEAQEATRSSNTTMKSPYASLIAQLAVGFLALGRAIEKDDSLSSLEYVAKYVPINPRYALYGLRKFLGERLKYLYEDTESTVEFEKTLEVAGVPKKSRKRRPSHQDAAA
jgi:hypothetical protein